MRGDRLGWITRLKLCWSVLIKGTYDPKEYRTREAQKQWDLCRRRDKEMASTIRPRTETGERRTSSGDNRLYYTDYDQRNKFRKPDAKSGLYTILQK